MHLCLRQNDKVYLKQPRRKQPEAEKKKKKKTGVCSEHIVSLYIRDRPILTTVDVVYGFNNKFVCF